MSVHDSFFSLRRMLSSPFFLAKLLKENSKVFCRAVSCFGKLLPGFLEEESFFIPFLSFSRACDSHDTLDASLCAFPTSFFFLSLKLFFFSD